MPATKLHEESERFGDFYVPRFEIRAGGGALPQSVVHDVLQVTYKDNLTEIDSFDIVVNNWDPSTLTFRYVGSETTRELRGSSPDAERYQVFEPCAREFSLSLGYGSELTPIITGTCTTLEPSFPAGGGPTLSVRILNVLHKLRSQKHNRHWSNQRESAIAREVGRDLSIPLEIDQNASSNESPIEYVAQTDQYDIDFLLQRARIAGYVMYVDRQPGSGGRPGREFVYFGPSDQRRAGRRNVTYELEWGTSLIDFRPTLSTARQVRSVEVRSWNRETNRQIRGIANLRNPAIRINADLLPILERTDCEPREELVVNEPMFNERQAEARAVAILSDRLKELVTARGKTIGLPDLRAGQRIEIRGVGSRFSGTYFVTETTHTLNDSGYFTEFGARREQPESGGAA